MSNTTTALSQVFVYEDRPLRTAGTVDAPLFVAADVCRCLELADTEVALRRLDEDEKGTCSIRTLGGPQQMLCVTEPGLYALVLGSRKPAARAFKRWVTHEVIPAIRKTGSYGAPAMPSLEELVKALVPAFMAEWRKLVDEQAQQSAYVRPFQARLVKQSISSLAKARTHSNPDTRAYRRERSAIEHELREAFQFHGTGKRWELLSISRWPDMEARLESMRREAGRIRCGTQLALSLADPPATADAPATNPQVQPSPPPGPPLLS
jgi:prophage antirepressor-like protein